MSRVFGGPALLLSLFLLANACASAPPLPVQPNDEPPPFPPASEPARIVVPDCALQEVAYFRCMLDAREPGAVAVCGRASADGVPTDVQVRVSAPDGSSVIVPARTDAAPSALEMEVETRPQFSSQRLTFESNGRKWTIFSEHDVAFGPHPPHRGLSVKGRRSDLPDAWSCVRGGIDRLGELEPLLASGRASCQTPSYGHQ